MKHPFAHISAGAPLHLLRSAIFHFSRRANRVSISRDYLGLCSYIEWRTSIRFAEGARVTFRDEGFLSIATERSSFRGWTGPAALYCLAGSELAVFGFNQLGRGSLLWLLEGGTCHLKGCSTSGNNMIVAKQRIEIDEGTQIAWGAIICDHDFHKTYTKGQQNPETAPIRIGKNVWIGMNAMVLKGVDIGDNSIVAAGAVVTRSVPAGSMVAGVPARVVKENVEFYG